MHRIFGKAKPKKPTASLSDVGKKVDARVTNLDAKILKEEKQLLALKKQIVS